MSHTLCLHDLKSTIIIKADESLLPNDLRILVLPWMTVAELLGQISLMSGIDPKKQRLFYRSQEITKNLKLTLSFFGITNLCELYLQTSKPDKYHPIIAYGKHSIFTKEHHSLIRSCSVGLVWFKQLIATSGGTGGSYFLTNHHNQKQAVFKPHDEETQSLLMTNYGIRAGNCYLREIAAYLIDQSIPCTLKIELQLAETFHNRQKIGSLQKFIVGKEVGNFGTIFYDNFSVRQVHKIGILDIRILNGDRNGGNLLLTKDELSRWELVPIDHGLAFVEKLNIAKDAWIWLDWPQTKQKFDPFTVHLINNINIERDIARLRKEVNFSEIVFENLRISCLVLKKCTNHGLTLYEIGCILTRPNDDTLSIIEQFMIDAEILANERWRRTKDDDCCCMRSSMKRSNTMNDIDLDELNKPRSKSQDDNLMYLSKSCRNKAVSTEFVIKRILNEQNKSIHDYFLFYLEQLLDIQCERIIRWKHQNDADDDIYDIDTPNGGFIWKNELRKHWITARLERKNAFKGKERHSNPFDGQHEHLVEYEDEKVDHMGRFSFFFC